MDGRVFATALSALRRAGIEAEPAGDFIAMAPDEIISLIDAASGVQDGIEIEKYELGIASGILTDAAVLLANWPAADGGDPETNARTILAVRAGLRRSDRLIRRGRSEVFAIVRPVTDAAVAAALARRIRGLLPGRARVGYIHLPHPTRLTTALAMAEDALARASAVDPDASVATLRR